MQLKLSGTFRLDPVPLNFVSHNANMYVKEGYIMVPRELDGVYFEAIVSVQGGLT